MIFFVYLSFFWLLVICIAGVSASRARASGQGVVGKTVDLQASAKGEHVSAETEADGQTVGAGADATRDAGKVQGAARCGEIQELALANAGGGHRSTLGAGEIK